MDKCLREPEIAILQEHVKTIYRRIDETNKRQDKFDERQDVIYEISKSIAVMAEQMQGTREDVKEIKEEMSGVKKDVGALKEKMQYDEKQSLKEDAKSWKDYKWYLFLTITGIILGYVFKGL